MKLSILFGACVLAVTSSAVARGQHPIEAGVARDAHFGSPIECLHVSVLDSARKTIAHAVTDSAGQFQIEVPGPGAYRVQFEVHGWAPLAGPIDTLADGDFKQRLFPVDFRERFQPDTTAGLDSAEGLSEQQRREVARRRFFLAMTALERASGWQSPQIVPSNVGLRFPPRHFSARDTGAVLARFIVDSGGRVRAQSWRVVAATDGEFESAVRKAMPRGQWKPAQIGDRPVCSLVQVLTEFRYEGAVGHIIIWE